MAISDESAALRAKNVITEKNESFSGISIPKIISLIPTCLEIWAREAIKIPNKKPLFEQDVEIEFVSGVADLTGYFDGQVYKIDNASFSACSNLSFDGQDIYTKWVNSLAQLRLPRNLAGVFVALYLDGNNLRSQNTDGSLTSLNGNATGRFIALPTTTADVPQPIEGDFIQALAAMSTGLPYPPPPMAKQSRSSASK